MTQQVPEEVFVLRVEEQVEGVARFLDALGIVPEALQVLSAEINATPIGDLNVFRAKGAQLAQAVAAGYQASIRGALAGGITPADFALNVVGGDELRRALQGSADAAAQYAQMLQAINDATARSKALGSPIFATPALPGAVGPNVSSRLQVDESRARRFDDRLEGVLLRLERQGTQAGLGFSDQGVIGISSQRLATPADLPSAREESRLRRVAEQQAIATNRAILDRLDQARARENQLAGSHQIRGELSAESIEAQLGARNASTFIRGRDVPQGVSRRLDTDTRRAIFGDETFDRGARIRGPGFTTPEREFASLLQERVSASRVGFNAPLELQTRAAAQQDADRRAAARQEADDRQAARRAENDARIAEQRRNEAAENERSRRFIETARAQQQAVEPPPLPRGTQGADPAALVDRLRGAGLGDDDIQSALGNLGFKTAEARELVQGSSQATTPVSRLADVVERLGAAADDTAPRLGRLVAGRGGIALPGTDNLPAVTGETLAEARLRIGRSQPALEGTFPRADIDAERLQQAQVRAAGDALRQRLLGGPLALTTGGGGSALIPFVGSSGGAGFGGPFGPGRPPPPPRGPSGFGQVPFDFDDLDDRTRARSSNRRRAREAFNDSDTDFESQINEEARRRDQQRQRAQDARDRQNRSRIRDENAAFREQRSRTLGDEPFFSTIRDSFTGPNGEPFGRQFKSGLVGGRFGAGADLGLQLGQTAKFSLLYGAAYSALFQVSQAISAVTTETLAYEDALVSLEIASGRTRSTTAVLAENLSESAARAGIAPSVGVQLGAQSLGLFGANTASRAVQDQTAEITTRVASQVARITKQDPTEVATQLAGTARSLGLGVESLPDIQDTLDFISRRTGRSIGDLLPAISNVGTLGTGAGFSAEELAAIIGQVTSTTGQTPSAAAGSFRQVLSRADDPNFNAKVGAQFGFDATGLSLRDIFANVAATKPNRQEINEFSLLFGRGASQQVAQILTRDFPRVEQLAAGAQAAAGTGIGEQDFNRVMATIGNQVRVFGTDLLELGQDLADTGIADSLALLIRALNGTVEAVDSVIDLFNEIPRPIRSIAFALGELLLIARLVGGTGVVARAGEAIIANVAATSASQAAVGTAGLGRGAVVGAGLAGGVRRGLSRFGPAAAVLGAGFAIDGLFDAASADIGTRSSLGIAQRQFANAETAPELRNAAAAARETERKARAQQGFDLSTLGLTTLANNTIGNAESRESAAANLRAEAKRQADELDRLAKRRDVSPAAQFGNFDSVDTVNAALSTLADRGFTATQRIEALNVAFDAMIARSTKGPDALATLFQGQGPDFSAAVGRASTQALFGKRGVIGPLRAEADAVAPNSPGAVLSDLFLSGDNPLGFKPQGRFLRNLTGGFNPFDTSPREEQIHLDRAADDLGNVNLGRLAKRSGRDALEVLRDRGKDPSLGNVELDAGDVAAINAAVADRAKKEIGPLLDNLPKALQKRILAAYTKSLSGQIRGTLTNFSGQQITPDNAQGFLAGTLADAPQVGADKTLQTGDKLLGSGRVVGVLRAARKRVTDALSAQNITDEQRKELYRQLAAFDLQILAAENAATADRLARAESLATLEESKLGSDDKLGRGAIELGLLDRQIDLEPDVDKRNQLKGQRNDLRQQQGKDAVAAANSGALAGIDSRNTLARTRQQLANAQRTLGTLTPDSEEFNSTLDEINQLKGTLSNYAFDLVAAIASNVDPRNTVAVAGAAVVAAQQQLAAAQSGGDPLAIAQARAAVTQANVGAIQSRVELDSSRIGLRVAGNDSTLAQSRNALKVAQNNLTGQLVNTQGYYEALAQVRSAQRALAIAERDAAALQGQLRGDQSDPLETARDATRAARARLRSDRRSGQGRDVIRQDRLDVTSAELNQDQTRFSQRLNDAQIANDLGQTSHAQYLHFLDSEHSRLTERIAGMKRTDDGYRQAVEQLQQIDQALAATKDALDGQFNLGDIDVPTPFQVRRFVAATTAGVAQPGGVVTTNLISIDGTDIGLVTKVLQGLIGTGAVPTATTAAPKG